MSSDLARPTVFCGVPTLYAAMVAHLDAHGVPEATLRRCISAGEALPENVGQRWVAHMGVDILDGVGSKRGEPRIGWVSEDGTAHTHIQQLTLHPTQNPHTIVAWASGFQLKRTDAYSMIVPKIENALVGSFRRVR